jgi:itaconate CoA-transferase
MATVHDQQTRPLEGVTVVSLEQAIAAPLCTRHLADLGARVIKVERPQGGDFARAYDTRARGLASHFVWVNRSKESITLDLKQPEDLLVVERLLQGADVFVQNLAPGATARLGLAYGALRERFPRLIVCDISGYGSDGPYRDRKAYDLLIQAEAGLLGITGTEECPSKCGAPAADIAAGMYAYSAVLAALIHREHTGVGSHLDVSMLESLLEWMGYPLYYALDGAKPPARCGAAHAAIAPYGPYPTGDGATILLGVQNEREWAAFCSSVLQRPELTKDSRFASAPLRHENRADLDGLITEAFSMLDATALLERLEHASIASARMCTMADVWAHPQLAARGVWTKVDTPAGALPAWLPPARHSGFRYRMGAVPALGEHTAAILAETGLSRDRARPEGHG